MRGLLISDIHANPWALWAVEKQAGPVDFIICAGDLVNYGPDPVRVLDWARDNGVQTVLGNHDYAVAVGADPKASPTKQPLALPMRDWTRQQLSQDHYDFLAKLRKTRELRFDGARFLVLHATPLDPLYDYRIKPSISDAELANFVGGVDADVLVVGHTHLPLARKHGPLQIINPGSVGQPLDDDPRAAYAIWNDGGVQLLRTAYDQKPALDAIRRLPCLTPEQRATLSKILLYGRST
jgi:putative phosphoesterase